MLKISFNNIINMISIVTASLKESTEVVIKNLKNKFQVLKVALNDKNALIAKNSNVKIIYNQILLGTNTPKHL